MKPVVLASQSQSRAALLSAAGVVFSKVSSGVDEDAIKQRMLAECAGPKAIAEALGEAKAVAVSNKTTGLVIGADQTLDLAGELFDKAANVDEARQRLVAMRGRTHQLHGGLVVAEEGRVVWRHAESSTLTMRDFSDAFLDAYLARHGQAVLSSVGCYHLEGAGAQLFERIEGDYFAILGLPLLPLLAFLREQGAIAS
ncbi:Maf family protein [Phenylobacterium montanum]|uniref:Nucleoside triphosphate pyrophosphatase n=1 Tax=Phenylobacterium montanum TaxID=2823693 RepID=A0A975ITN5_9CAUL|nr:Maf family protein [Caulobacter sp. S6]QUD86654.1 Maf family protein [Caulobacter sp. S6]